jgi:hypothetical protein
VDHRTTDELEAALPDVRQAPADGGTVELIVRRPSIEAREVLDEGELDLGVGLVGDNWSAKPTSSTPDGSPHPGKQITLVNARAVAVYAPDPDMRPWAGDQFHVDLDIGVANLPPGIRVAQGQAVVEVTAEPHTGCHKFSARFGADALRWVNSPVGRELRLRGVNAKVVVPGKVRRGDVVKKVV